MRVCLCETPTSRWFRTSLSLWQSAMLGIYHDMSHFQSRPSVYWCCKLCMYIYIYIYITNNHQLEHLLIPILYSLYCHYRLLEPAQILLYVSLPLYTVCMCIYIYTCIIIHIHTPWLDKDKASAVLSLQELRLVVQTEREELQRLFLAACRDDAL